MKINSPVRESIHAESAVLMYVGYSVYCLITLMQRLYLREYLIC